MTLISGLVSLVIGILITWMTLNLPEASIGIPNAPKAFPGGLGVLMIIFSAALIGREILRLKKEPAAGGRKESTANPFLLQIGLTCLFGVLYAVLFKVIGYVLSTFLFLTVELWLFNGAKWKINLIVAISFSLFIYLMFSKALGVYLPQTPIIWF